MKITRNRWEIYGKKAGNIFIFLLDRWEKSGKYLHLFAWSMGKKWEISSSFCLNDGKKAGNIFIFLLDRWEKSGKYLHLFAWSMGKKWEVLYKWAIFLHFFAKIATRYCNSLQYFTFLSKIDLKYSSFSWLPHFSKKRKKNSWKAA